MVRNKREDIAMLIQFSVSNFLSFNEKETFSMIAGKARKNIDRVFSNKKIKLTKCEVILGANASGKSNLEICFVCKTAQGKSIINPLEKYQLRADKKVYAALFDGTLDAGPSFDEEKLSRLSE